MQPNDGFAVLLPNEQIQFTVSLSPLSAIPYNLPLTLTTSFNDQYVMKVLGNGIEPPVMFDSPVIHLRPTIPGEKVLESTIIRNNTKTKQSIELIVPDNSFSWLKISPNVIILPPNGVARVEVEYNPPLEIFDEDPIQWHNKLLELKKTSVLSSSSSSIINTITPFQQWLEEDGWAYASGPFGELQWKQKNWKPSNNNNNNNVNVDVDGDDDEILPGVGDDEWGIIGKYHIPVYMKPSSIGAITKDTVNEMLNLLPPPLFFCLETVITKPEFIVDTNSIDFGQIAVGIRVIKTVKLKNISLNRSMTIHSNGLNAVGPFNVVNACRTIEPGQWHTLVIECQPILQGLLIEVLELSCSDGGPRITLTLRVQGVNPSIEISGLEPAPLGWSPLGGILNFGNVISTDERIKKFTIHNKSLFTIEATIERAICAGVPPSKQNDLIQRTLTGLPIFSCRPEVVVIPEGGSVDVEMIFRPDRSRLYPFREDFNILVGKGDHPVKICSFGRSRSRQMIVRTVNPYDEPFINENIQDETDEDIFLSHSSEKIRSITNNLYQLHSIGKVPDPIIKLAFPDPYIEQDDGVSIKIQSKQLAINCLEFYYDSRQVGSGPGSYEFKLSEEAVKSKYFTLINDKGNVPVGGELLLTINCTLPRPKGLGGLEVGSWQVFQSNLVLKGGWRPVGEDADVIIPVLLSAYVRL